MKSINWTDVRIKHDRCAVRLRAKIFQYTLEVYGTIKFSVQLEEQGEDQMLERINKFDTIEEAQAWCENKLRKMLQYDLDNYQNKIPLIKEFLNGK